MKTLLALLLSLVITGTAAAQVPLPSAQPSIDLPPALDRVLRDYEKFWRAKDPAGLSALFTEDGFVLANRTPPVRGRAAIRAAYAGKGGPLFLRAFAFSIDGSTGYIIGGYRGQEAGPDEGKFVLALRKDRSGHWLIAADMDNGNQRPQ
jgi:ketosteroid isomerase-like protein